MIKRFHFHFRLVILFSLLFIYFFSRFYHLAQFPIFCDEAIYIRWAQVMKSIPSLWWVPLSDGKQPLFMWLTGISLFFWQDPLLAGRFVSLLAGMAESFVLWRWQRLLFPEDRNFFLPLIYVFLPFTLFFNRLALVDTLLSFFITLAFFFAWRLLRFGRWKDSFGLGLSLGMAWLTKSPGEIFWFLLPPLLLFLTAWQLGCRFWQKKAFWQLVIQLVFAGGLAFALYNLLRFAPVFYMIARRNRDYLWSWPVLRQHPLDPLWPHLGDVWRYYWHYLGPLSLILAFIGLGVLSWQRRWRFLAFLFIWWLPVLPMAAVAKVFTARYILYSAIPLICLMGSSFIFFFKFHRQFTFFLFGLWLLTIMRFDIALLWHYRQLPLPADEYRGYLSDWTAGEGIRQIAAYLHRQQAPKGIVVATEGFFGTLPNGLQIYFDKDKKVTIVGSQPEIRKVPTTIIAAKKFGARTYLVVNKSRFKIAKPQGLELRQVYPKPGGDALLLFELKDVHKN